MNGGFRQAEGAHYPNKSVHAASESEAQHHVSLDDQWVAVLRDGVNDVVDEERQGCHARHGAERDGCDKVHGRGRVLTGDGRWRRVVCRENIVPHERLCAFEHDEDDTEPNENKAERVELDQDLQILQRGDGKDDLRAALHRVQRYSPKRVHQGRTRTSTKSAP